MTDLFYKKSKNSLVLIIAVILLLSVFFIAAAFLSSLGYEASLFAAKITPVEAKPTPIKTIIIDAGHGGEDPGAVVGDIKEKDINLKVALKLAAFMELSGMNVVLTRSEDKLLYGENESDNKKMFDLKNRYLLAAEYENAIFVSIHMNKFHQADCFGLQTFYSGNAPESKTIAELIQSESKKVCPNNKRVAKFENHTIYILERLQIPAVLVECGFLSNPEEASLLVTDEYQSKLAFAIYSGIGLRGEIYENED